MKELPPPNAVPSDYVIRWDLVSNLEIDPCKEFTDESGQTYVERMDSLDDGEASYWTVYIRFEPDPANHNFAGVEAIWDVPTEQEAEEIAALVEQLYGKPLE